MGEDDGPRLVGAGTWHGASLSEPRPGRPLRGRSANDEYHVRVLTSIDIDRLIADTEQAILDVISAAEDARTRGLYAMVRYHLGLDGEAPRGKRIRPLIGLLAYQSHRRRPRARPARSCRRGDGPQLQPRPRRHRGRGRERRHRPALWTLAGIPQAINTGDTLFTLSRLALHRLSEAGFEDARVLRLMRLYDETCLALCEGQYLDIWMSEHDEWLSVEAYYDMIGRKTAALIAGSAEAGAILATDDEVVVAAYRRFGWSLGLAFQLNDDLLGIWGDEATTGKEASDIATRKKTLPLIYALEEASGPDAERLRTLLAIPGADATPEELEESRRILERVGCPGGHAAACPGASRRRRWPRSRRWVSWTARRSIDSCASSSPPSARRRAAHPAGAGRRRLGTDDPALRRVGTDRSGLLGLDLHLRRDDAHDVDGAHAPAVGRLDREAQAVDLDGVSHTGHATACSGRRARRPCRTPPCRRSSSRASKCSQRSSTSARPSTRAAASPRGTIMGSSSSYSSWISPTISSMRSSMETRPAVPPCSSRTIAIWTRRRCRLWRRSSTSIDSGTNSGVRRRPRIGRRAVVAHEVGQQVLGVEDADDVVDAAVVDRDARVALRARSSRRSGPVRRPRAAPRCRRGPP